MGGRQTRGLVLQDLRDADRLRGAARPVGARRAGDDAVEVGRKHLRFLQRLTSTRRAAVPVGVLRRVAIERVDDGFAFEHHLVLGAIREVDRFFRMAHREARAAADVACVGGTGRIAAPERVSHRGVADGARPRAVADRLILAVPARACRAGALCGGGEPDFDLDVRVARRLQRRRHAAERRQVGERIATAAGAAARLRETAGRDDLRCVDRALRQRERRETLACRRACISCREQNRQNEPGDPSPESRLPSPDMIHFAHTKFSASLMSPLPR